MSAPYAFRWKNYRGFTDTGWIPMSPLTLVIGRNNSGKTALHAPLRMLKQTWASSDDALQLLPKGPLVDCGSFRDFASCNSASTDTVEFLLKFDDSKGAKRKSGVPQKASEVGDEPPGSLELQFSGGAYHEPVVLRRYLLRDTLGREMLRRERRKDGKYSLSVKFAKNAALAKLKQDQPSHFLFSAHDLLYNRFTPKTKPKASATGRRAGGTGAPVLTKAEVKFSRAESMYISALMRCETRISQLLSQIAYLGPLREPPKRLYEISGREPRDVGVRGEYAPELLYRYIANKTLTNKVNKWVREFEFGEGLDVVPLREVGAFSINVRGSNARTHSFVDTGFGMSQLLPLLVEGYRDERLRTIIVEQPEIHLNSRLQVKLADLLVDIIKSGKKRVLVETHSEQLLLRLRWHISEGSISVGDLSLNYVEPGAETPIRNVRVEKDGSIRGDEWPDNFLSERLEQALALAESQARRHAGG